MIPLDSIPLGFIRLDCGNEIQRDKLSSPFSFLLSPSPFPIYLLLSLFLHLLRLLHLQLSCELTCDSGPLSVIVMRESSGMRVDVTVRESMLKPRADRRPTTFARTPYDDMFFLFWGYNDIHSVESDKEERERERERIRKM